MNQKKTILITGANGFIGQALTKELLNLNYNVNAVIRPLQYLSYKPLYPKCKVFQTSFTDLELSDAMYNVNTVVHLAARVHVIKDTSSDPLASFRKANVDFTKRLVKLAISSKVKRLIFISSLSLYVSGVKSYLYPFNEKDMPCPKSPYAISKWEAEQYLSDIARKTDLEIVIIRPPLVYGPAVKANFLSLLKLTKTGLPMPVGMLNNKRSMVSLNNLVNFIICCIENLKAVNETFFISDDNDVSTKELFAKLILLFGKSPLLLPVSSKILYGLGILSGKKKIVDRLCAPLQVDITKAKTMLNWKPVQTVDDGLKETVEWYKEECLRSQ